MPDARADQVGHLGREARDHPGSLGASEDPERVLEPILDREVRGDVEPRAPEPRGARDPIESERARRGIASRRAHDVEPVSVEGDRVRVDPAGAGVCSPATARRAHRGARALDAPGEGRGAPALEVSVHTLRPFVPSSSCEGLQTSTPGSSSSSAAPWSRAPVTSRSHEAPAPSLDAISSCAGTCPPVEARRSARDGRAREETARPSASFPSPYRRGVGRDSPRRSS